MRTACGVDDGAKCVVRVGRAEDELACVLVDGWVGLVAQMRDAEEGWEVGVVLSGVSDC